MLDPLTLPVKLAARIGLMIAGDHLDQRRFARAVVAEQSHHFIRADFEVDIVQRLHFAEGLGDVLHLEDIVHLGNSWSGQAIGMVKASGVDCSHDVP